MYKIRGMELKWFSCIRRFGFIVLMLLLGSPGIILFIKTSNIVLVQCSQSSTHITRDAMRVKQHHRPVSSVCNVVDFSVLPPANYTCYLLNTTPSPKVRLQLILNRTCGHHDNRYLHLYWNTPFKGRHRVSYFR